MHRVVRAFLVWVMVVAMPVQGMAASAMLFCGPSHERMMQALVPGAQAGAGQIDKFRDGRAAVGHAVHFPTVQLDAAASEPSADGAVGLYQQHGKVGCSACAACCSALALPAGFAFSESQSPARAVRMSPSAPVASHQPDGLDRPPRVVLA